MLTLFCEEAKIKRNKEIFEWFDAIIIALIFFVVTFTMMFRFVVVNGNSMLPTFVNGDWAIIYNFLYTPVKGDIVVINDLDCLDESIIKRVVAVENDEIKIDNETGKLYVNGVAQNDDFCYSRGATFEGDYEIPETVPDGCIFVMGDNRENSFDSRYKLIGPVQKEKVLGTAKAIIFPLKRIRLFN